MNNDKEYLITEQLDMDALPPDGCTVHYMKINFDDIAYARLKSAIRNEEIADAIARILNGAKGSVPRRICPRTMTFVEPADGRTFKPAPLPKLKRGDEIIVIRFRYGYPDVAMARSLKRDNIDFYLAEIALRDDAEKSLVALPTTLF